MLSHLDFQPVDPAVTNDIDTVVGLWQAACGANLAISPRFARYNLRASAGGEQQAWFARHNGRAIGFVAASYLNDATVAPPHMGWLDALAVHPDRQGQGGGRALLHHAERWLAEAGAARIAVGAGLRPFVPGVPDELQSVGFFTHHGYDARLDAPQVWDLAADLAHYQSPRNVLAAAGELDAVIRPAQREDYAAMLTFLQRESPDRWRFEFEQYLAEGGRISDYMVLWTARGVDGCCVLTFEDSVHPIERFYPYQLPRPWGQLGSIGISADRRGQGFGAALLDAGLRRLHNTGVNGCVIDWTDLLDFYAKFDFKPYRTYHMLHKTL